MSKYARTRIVTEVSEASDYSRPKVHASEILETPDEFRLGDLIEIATAGQTYYLQHLSSLTQVRIRNTDTTNYMTVTYTRVATSTNIIRLAAGDELVIPGVDITASGDLTLQANTAAVVAEISYLGT